jgi:NitT/TauT family transport system substrate-binding protein
MAVLVGGCTSAPAASPASAPSPVASPAASPAAKPAGQVAPAGPKPATRERTTVAIGSRFAVAYLQFDVAKALGYYEDENLDADLQYLVGGTQAATALLSGQAQFSGNSMDHIVKAKIEGKDLLLVASLTAAPGITMVVSQKYADQIKSPADLKGRRVGVTALGAGTHTLLLNVLAKVGLSANDVQVVPVGSDTMPAALEADQVVAAMGNDPYVSQLKQAGKAFFLVDFTTEADTTRYLGFPYQFTGLLTTADIARSKPDLTQRMVNAITRACQFIGSNTPRQISERLPREVTGDDLEAYVLGLEHNYPALTKDCMASEAGVQSFVQSQVVAEIITADKAPRPAELFDMSFVRKTLGQ